VFYDWDDREKHGFGKGILDATRRKSQGLRTGPVLLDIMNIGTQK
jgi:hypothetical protein